MDQSAVQLHKVLDDGESETGAPHLPRTSLVDTIEPIEDLLQGVLRDTRTRVPDGDADDGPVLARGHDHGAAVRDPVQRGQVTGACI